MSFDSWKKGGDILSQVTTNKSWKSNFSQFSLFPFDFQWEENSSLPYNDIDNTCVVNGNRPTTRLLWQFQAFNSSSHFSHLFSSKAVCNQLVWPYADMQFFNLQSSHVSKKRWCKSKVVEMKDILLSRTIVLLSTVRKKMGQLSGHGTGRKKNGKTVCAVVP